MKHIIALLILIATAAPAQARQCPNASERAIPYPAHVTRVVDGDTVILKVALGFNIVLESVWIRMIGINAPEKRGRSRTAGKAASAFLTGLVGDKDIIICILTTRKGKQRKGKYGRWLGRLYLNGLDINQRMIDAGHAVEARY